jgi:hypothetical protein
VITVTQVHTIEQLMKLWKHLYKLDETIQPAIMLAQFLRCLDGGAIFTVKHFDKLIGHATVEVHENVATILSLPKQEEHDYTELTLSHIKTWASKNGVRELLIGSRFFNPGGNFNGSKIRYFKKIGFTPKILTFSMWVKPKPSVQHLD